MTRTTSLLGALIGAAIALPVANAAGEEAGARQQSVQSQRYGAPLGLPRDGSQLYLPDDAYPRFPLPPGNEAYAHVDGLKLKAVVEEITAISRKSRNDGNQYWGRIAGTPYDKMTSSRLLREIAV